MVEELAELLDLVLLLVGHLEARLVEDVLGTDDLAAGTEREGDRVGRPGSGRGGTTPCWAKAIAVASTAPIQMGR